MNESTLRAAIRKIIQQEMLIIKDEESEYQTFFNSALKKFGITDINQLSDTKKKEFFNYIDNNFKTKNEKDIDETSSISAMGGGDGYNTPGAFSRPGEDQKKKRALKGNEWEIVGENVDFRNNELSASRRLHQAVSSIRSSLAEIHNLVNKSSKFKQESGLSTDKYWVRTKGSLKKINEELIAIMNKLNNIK